MTAINRNFIYIAILLLSALGGCATVTKIARHGNLEVETKMSQTIFLEPADKKVVLLQIRNTTDKKNLDIESQIKHNIESKGYRITNDAREANILLQANILQIGKSSLEDPFQYLNAGYGGALAGAAVGAVATGTWGGAAGGAVAGSAIDTLLDVATELVKYTMITDLQVSEKINNRWKKHQTRIVSVATKVNLKFNKAKPLLMKGIVNSISGLL